MTEEITLEEQAPPIETMEEQAPPAEQVEETAPPQESDQEINFRRMRETNDRLREQSEHDRKMMMQMQEQMYAQSKPQQPVQEEADELSGIDPSDWATFDQTQKVAERIADSRFEKKMKEYEARRKKEEAPARIRSNYKDFDTVVTKENVEQLKARDPDVFAAFQMIGDEEKQAIAVYKYLQKSQPEQAAALSVKKSLEENDEKPKSLSSVGGRSPLSQAASFEGGLTPELKAHLYAEMQACSRMS